MDGHLLGASFAISSALIWAFAIVLYKKGDRVPPPAVNLTKNLVALLLLIPTILAAEGGFSIFGKCSPADLAILSVSGFIGITLADTLFFYSLKLAGAGLVSIADAAYAPFIFLFSALILGERLLAAQYAGAALIVIAVGAASRHEPPPDRTRGQVLLGVLLCVLSMAIMTFGIVIAKPAIERTPLFSSTAIRVAAGTAFLIPAMAAFPQRREVFAALRPSSHFRAIVPASILGYIALIFWMGGFQKTYASLAGALNQTSSVFTIALAAWFLKEPLTRRKLAALAAALAGVALVMIPAALEEAAR